VGILVSTVSVGQHLTSYRHAGRVGVDVTDQMMLLDSRRVLYGDGATEETIGTPYLAETFDSADVYTRKGVFVAVPMRLNIYEDYLEFKNKEGVYILDPALNIDRVDFRDYRLVVEKTDVGGKMKLGFFELLDSGKVTLLAKKVVSYRQPQPVKAMEDAKPGRFTKKDDEYFFKIQKGQLMEVGSIKKFIEQFPDKQNELKEFANKEKIDRKREDLVMLVQYYNSL